jgi:hypothetical protein
MRWIAVLPLLCHFAVAEELTFPSPAASTELAFPLGNGALFTRLDGAMKREAFPLWLGLENANPPATPERPGLGFAGITRAEFTFEWLDAAGEVKDYRRRLDLKAGTAVVTFKRGGAGFTWTTFISKPDDLMVLHLRTDKPGALSFRVQLQATSGKAKVEDRRMLALRDQDLAARAWVYPMESEVTPGENEITVRGEGEALILLAATADAGKIPALDGRIVKLAGEGHPDTFALWTGLLERQRETHRKANPAATFAGYLDEIRK